jgi:hypothetical protein
MNIKWEIFTWIFVFLECPRLKNLQNNFFFTNFLNLLYQEITLKLRESILELPVIFWNYSSLFIVLSRKRQSKEFFDYLGHTFFYWRFSWNWEKDDRVSYNLGESLQFIGLLTCCGTTVISAWPETVVWNFLVQYCNKLDELMGAWTNQLENSR